MGSLATIELNRANTDFVFIGGRDGQVVLLAMKQDSTGSRSVSFGSEVREGTDITLPLSLTATANYTDYAMFIYRDDESKWDIIDFKKGYAPVIAS